MSVLAHTRAGAGSRALFLLHGFLGSARNLAALARGLAQRLPDYSVISLDLTGHGESPPLPPRPDVAIVARDVLDTARALELPAPWTLVGHSLGGRVALRAARLEPDALAHLTLLDVTPSPRAPGGEVAAIVKALADAPDAARDRQTFRTWFRRAGLSPAAVDWLLLNLAHEGDGYRWRIDRQTLVALYAEIGAEDLWPAIEMRRPYGVHVIRGGASEHVSDADVARLEAAGCRVDTLDGASHFVHVDRPRELLDRIVQGLGLMEASMATREADLVRVREHVTATIRRGTELLADLKSLDDWLQALIPALARLPESEREILVARLCGYDTALPDRLRQLIEGLADLVAGLTASDGGQAWVRQHVARVESGEETDAA